MARYFLLWAIVSTICSSALSVEIRLIAKDQSVVGAVQNNLAAGNAVQGNNVNIIGTSSSGSSNNAVTGIIQNNAAGANATQGNQVNIVGTTSSSGAPSGEGQRNQDSGIKSSSNTSTKSTTTVPSSSGGSDAQSSNSNAVVSGNNVSGGIQENSSTNQHNAGSNQNIVGSIQDSHDIYNDHRNVTMFSKTDVNQTYFQNSMTNNTENSYTNNSRLVNVVNNYNYSIVNPVQVMNYSYGVQASQSQNVDSRQTKPAPPSSYILSASPPRYEISYISLAVLISLLSII
jgi:hypothetical protein